MTLYALLKLVHVVAAMWLVSGLLARAVALSSARRSSDMRIVKAIADVSGRLENLMIAPGVFAVVISGVAAAFAGGISLFGPLTGGPWWIFIPVALMAIAIAIGPWTLAHDRKWGEALGDAAAQGAVTERLRPFLTRDAMLRRYAPDIAFVGVIVVLMVLKPF